MASIEKNVHDIKDVLNDPQSSIKPNIEVVTHLANEYEKFFLQLAEKANRCLELLHEGSRQEAFKLACQDPDLRTLFACIDFDERLKWLKLCKDLGINCDNISTDNINACAGIIEKVYKNTDNLTELLRVHRRLALKRAPLGERLKVLRMIAQQDHMNGAWAEDVKVYEKEYLDELAKRSEQAVHQKDLHALEEISSQLHSTDWRVRLSEKFVKMVDQYVLDNRQRQANAQLEQIAEHIHKAHAAMDEQECQSHYDTWIQVLEKYGVEPSTELSEQIQPAIKWLTELREARNENDAFNEACLSLEQSLDEDCKVDVIEKQAAKILSFERGMPELLAARFTSKMQGLKLKRKRTFSIMITVVVGILLIITVGMAVVFSRYDQNRQLTRWQQQISSALNSNNLESAGKLLSQVKNERQKLFYAPEIQQLDSQYQQKCVLDQERKHILEQMLASFETQDISALTPEMLEKAEQMCQGINEKASVFEWRTKYNDFIRTKQQQQDQIFEAQLNQLEAEYSKYQLLSPLERTKVEREVRECLLKAEELITIKEISAGLLSRARVLREKIRNDIQRTQDEIAKKQNIEEALARLAKPYKNSAEMSTGLRAFVNDYQGHELSGHFIKALKYEKEWLAVDAWTNLVQSWRPNLLTGDPGVIQQRLDQIDNYLKANPSNPYRNQISAYESYLKLAQTKLELLQIVDLENALKSPLVAESLMVESSNGDCYYMLENTFRPFQETRYQFKYIADSALKEKSAYLLKNEIDPEGLKPSPQSAFSEKSLKMLSNIRSNGWETAFLDLALECAQDPKMDCILRANLIKLFLQSAKNIVPYKPELIVTILDNMEKAAIDIDINWIDPTNPKARQLRPEVRKLVTSSSNSIKQAIKEINAQLQTLQDSLEPVQLAGIVLGQGNAVIIHRQQSTRNGRAMVIEKKGGNDIVFVEVGKIINYELLGKPIDAPQGTPVFVISD